MKVTTKSFIIAAIALLGIFVPCSSAFAIEDTTSYQKEAHSHATHAWVSMSFTFDERKQYSRKANIHFLRKTGNSNHWTTLKRDLFASGSPQNDGKFWIWYHDDSNKLKPNTRYTYMLMMTTLDDERIIFKTDEHENWTAPISADYKVSKKNPRKATWKKAAGANGYVAILEKINPKTGKGTNKCKMVSLKSSSRSFTAPKGYKFHHLITYATHNKRIYIDDGDFSTYPSLNALKKEIE